MTRRLRLSAPILIRSLPRGDVQQVLCSAAAAEQVKTLSQGASRGCCGRSVRRATASTGMTGRIKAPNTRRESTNFSLCLLSQGKLLCDHARPFVLLVAYRSLKATHGMPLRYSDRHLNLKTLMFIVILFVASHPLGSSPQSYIPQ
jgi:hypothetical protein